MGKLIELAYDYAAGSVQATVPLSALSNAANVQPLALRLAA